MGCGASICDDKRRDGGIQPAEGSEDARDAEMKGRKSKKTPHSHTDRAVGSQDTESDDVKENDKTSAQHGNTSQPGDNTSSKEKQTGNGSVKQDKKNTVKEDEAVEEIENMFKMTMNETAFESDEVSLAFESFLHNNGILYTCFNQYGTRVYFDEAKQGVVHFPSEWYGQGRFIVGTNEQVTIHNQAPSGVSQHLKSDTTFMENGRANNLYIQGKGMVMTYMFEERANICRYFDAQSGMWLLLPLQWEMNMDFVKDKVLQVMKALPGLVDKKEISAALRQCNYDPDDVISVYLSMFGDILLQPSDGRQNYNDLNSFRSHLHKDIIIEDLRQKLLEKEKEVESLSQGNTYLSRETQYLSEAVEHLRQRVAELEADKEEAYENIRALLARRSIVPPAKVASTPATDSDTLVQVRQFTRDLNISNKQLRSTVKHHFSEMEHQVKQILKAAVSIKEAETDFSKEIEELRAFYRKEALERKVLYNKLQELCGNIQVFCRCRGDSPENLCFEVASDEEVVVSHKGTKKTFFFDKVYSSNATQEELFNGILPMITSCVDGYNICILAYGQTGSGKTYTMMGTKDKPGVNIRSVRELLRLCKERKNTTYAFKMSMTEIYNENLIDLLSNPPTNHLEIRTLGKSIIVPDLTQIDVKTEEDILNVMELGEKNRTMASTNLNFESSRSHLILRLRLAGNDSVSGVTSHGTLTLCDLAGSERISRTEAIGQRLVEAAFINKSLTSLAQVFSALKCNALNVPFRNSKLTHVLQPSLSGDAKACVLMNISPDMKNVLETLRTLQFGTSIQQVGLRKATWQVTQCDPLHLTNLHRTK
ncbi:kinesin-like protein klp-3 isoform X1 [Lepisosteus oculatus]|uniref:kinesin-like protein klp-3 isoform X1 n=1 Tax=Lepisosteus oculatus TaxID=7918 RepID=UPI0037116DC7